MGTKIKITMLVLLATFFKINAQCEKKWDDIKRVNTTDIWKEKNTTSSGKVMWKTIEFNNDYAYKLNKVVATGFYYVQNYGFDKMFYYDNEKDAIRALFIWNRCGIFVDQGRVK